ncbi:pentatricopeptide repeat-containing protein, partial [Tanacetum coccineum]
LDQAQDTSHNTSPSSQANDKEMACSLVSDHNLLENTIINVEVSLTLRLQHCEKSSLPKMSSLARRDQSVTDPKDGSGCGDVYDGGGDYSCLVDLLGRAGRLHEAYAILKRTVSIREVVELFSTLFSACHIHGDLELGEKIGCFLVDKTPDDPSTYIMLANMYASLKKWDEARKVRLKMKELGLRKNPGCTLIEIEHVDEILHSRERLKLEKKYAEKDLHIKQAVAVKLEGKSLFSSRNISEATSKYSEALALCLVRSKKERVVLYSNRAKCYLLLQQPLGDISDATHAFCLHNPFNRHVFCLHNPFSDAQAFGITTRKFSSM